MCCLCHCCRSLTVIVALWSYMRGSPKKYIIHESNAMFAPCFRYVHTQVKRPAFVFRFKTAQLRKLVTVNTLQWQNCHCITEESRKNPAQCLNCIGFVIVIREAWLGFKSGWEKTCQFFSEPSSVSETTHTSKSYIQYYLLTSFLPLSLYAAWLPPTPSSHFPCGTRSRFCRKWRGYMFSSKCMISVWKQTNITVN